MSNFTTIRLMAMAEDLISQLPPQFFLDSFFPVEQSSTTQEVAFDIRKGKRRVSPFVHPLSPGQLVESAGFSTDILVPAYVKDKRLIRPTDAITRSAGEPFGAGTMSPQERRFALVQRAQLEQMTMWKRRLEQMAALTVLNASLTVEGENYPARVVNFQRNGTHTITLSAGARWNQTTADPLGDLDTWNEKILQETGMGAEDVVMDGLAWKLFRNHANVKGDLLETRRLSQTDVRTISSHEMEGAELMGVIGKYRIWKYVGWVHDGTSDVAIMPANTVAMVGKAYEGVRAFGAILDLDSLNAGPYFYKTWVDQDPSAQALLFQSSPLTYPRRPDASIRATVIS